MSSSIPSPFQSIKDIPIDKQIIDITNAFQAIKAQDSLNIKSYISENNLQENNVKGEQNSIQQLADLQQQILQQAERKDSLMEADLNCDEKVDNDDDIRRRINQKLLKNKNYFKDFIGTQKKNASDQIQYYQQDKTSTFVDKRSRSETPNKMSATEILYRAHQKLLGRRKDSPSKLLEKHQKRQKKAEELRSQIEQSRKSWFEKIKARQQIAKEKWQEMLAERKAKLQNKLELAEERRESEIQSLINKAKSEIQKIDETNYIMKLTMDNMKLDIDNKMNETQERRNQILEEYKQKQQERHQKEEAVYKRKQELLKETEHKLIQNQIKREQADQRRIKMLEDKRRMAEETIKRKLVLQRKIDLGDKISDIMSFVSNSENLWEFLGNEKDWQELGISDNDAILFELLSKDHYEIEKLRLKKDAELLNQLIIIDDNGKVFANMDLLPIALKKIKKEKNGQSSSDDEEEKDVKQTSISSSNLTPKILYEQSKTLQHTQDGGYISDESNKSIAEESKQNEISLLEEQQLEIQNKFEDDMNYHLYSNRLKMSMKRNILKKNLSEDLTWAEFLKSDNYQTSNIKSHFKSFISSQTKSMHSTPERKHDIPNEASNQAINIEQQNSNPSATSSSNSKKYKKGQKQNHSSSSNLSEKSRISSTVYPSKKKKRPNNKVGNQQIDSKNNSNNKRLAKSSNQNSTHSLIGIQQSTDDKRASVLIQKKGIFPENVENTSRMHSSSVQESSGNYLLNIQQQMLEENTQDKYFETSSNNSISHTGQQMTQLITNARPIPPQMKFVPKKLSINAIKMLFPIREQKLLFKRPGKEGQFGKTRITVKIEDLQNKLNTSMIQQQTSFSQITTGQQQVINSNDVFIDSNVQQQQHKSLQSTPSFHTRKQSTDTNNSSSNNNANTTQIQETNTPTQGRLLQQNIKLQQQMQNNESLTITKKTKISYSNLVSENSPSPKKEQKQQQSKTDESSFSINPNISINSIENLQTQTEQQYYKELIIKYLMIDNIQQLKNEDMQKTIVLEGNESDKLIDYLEQHEFQLRYCRLCDIIIPDQQSNDAHVQLKSHKRARDELGIKDFEDLQNSIICFTSLPGDIEKELLKEKEKALKRKVKRIKAEMNQLAISHESASFCPGRDFTSANKKRFLILCIDLEKQVIPIIKDYEALEITLKEIIKLLDMRKSADLHLMRKMKYIPILIEICKRISVCHKNEFKHLGKILEFVIKIINTFCGLRENRNYMLQTNRMQALIELLNWCLNRPTQLFYGISFMPQLFHILTAHVKHRAPYECQQMKEMYIEYLICSQITTKIKSKFQIINGPLDLSEMMGQVPIFLLKSAAFIESLTQLIQIDAKNRPVYEKSNKIGEHVLFVIQNTELFGIIPMITTILLSRNQPFKPSAQNQPITFSKVLPQTILSLAIISIKILNNIFRIDYRYAQQMMNDVEIQEQLYHLFNYLLVYAVETIDQNDDSKELLHETLLMIGYFCLNNEKNQQLMCRGEKTILQKLCNLPIPYFFDKKNKEILFPTLIQASYKNERSLAIMDQEISIEMLVDFISINLKEELPKIIEEEFDYQSMSSQAAGNAMERKTNRSPSLSSTNSSQCSLQLDMINGNSPYLPLYMRFPKKLWKDALAFYSKVLF